MFLSKRTQESVLNTSDNKQQIKVKLRKFSIKNKETTSNPLVDENLEFIARNFRYQGIL